MKKEKELTRREKNNRTIAGITNEAKKRQRKKWLTKKSEKTGIRNKKKIDKSDKFVLNMRQSYLKVFP